ncbi:MAG: hypothetical protein KKA73_17350 [Chloroflexi bacterium]|nr:hypothetical protein [Chloroflexota bacterium]MBU1749453.1 hypothetical protein [Chloroflexota bacterium]
MGLGVFFAQDLHHIITGLNDAATGLPRALGVHDAQGAAYLTGYRDALRTLSTCLGLVAPFPTTPHVLDSTARPADRPARALTVGALDEVTRWSK